MKTEDEEFEELSKKLDAETIDIRRSVVADEVVCKEKKENKDEKCKSN